MAHGNWPEIKMEYITTNISYRKLAAKWGVPFRTLSDQASKGGWKQERDRYRDDVTAKTLQKTAEKSSKSNVAKLSRLQQAADSMADVIARVFDDSETFLFGGKADTKAIKDLTGSMRDLAYVLRNIYDIPTRAEQSAMDIAAERLALDRQKITTGICDESETGVIIISPVVPDDDGGENDA